MAIMIPSEIGDYSEESLEDVLFDALKTGLSDNYFVFHSFRVRTVKDGTFSEGETDFLIYNREKGILSLEAKVGSNIHYQDRVWYYNDYTPMTHGGPYNQAANGLYRIYDWLVRMKLVAIRDKCKMFYGVWFPKVTDRMLEKMEFPPEIPKELTLTYEAIQEPQKYIDRIFDLHKPWKGGMISETRLSDSEHDLLLSRVLCPSFDIAPLASVDDHIRNYVFHRLLKEQTNILDFIEDQRVAAINGAAGTGKTLIAIEKARRNAAVGDKVLFLCYNSALRDMLVNKFSIPNVDYYTIDKLNADMCHSPAGDYGRLLKRLDDMFYMETFPWDHVIVDEGQDFGECFEYDQDSASFNVGRDEVLTKLRDIMELRDGTFYVFYDKMQLVQADHLPHFCEGADCRLTLYKNCRNTINIATTSFRPITDKDPKMYTGAVEGPKPRLFLITNREGQIAKLDALLSEYRDEKSQDIVILTVKTLETSILQGYVNNGFYRQKYRVSTCRKFKGLEADIVILIDIDRSLFPKELNDMDRSGMYRFYVGTSRARNRLDIICDLNDSECLDILTNAMGKKAPPRKARTIFASLINASIVDTE